MTPSIQAKKQKKWRQNSGLEVMIWPPQSADLNPIEHLWHHLKTRLGDYDRPPSGIAELWERVEKEWNEIPASICQNLIKKYGFLMRGTKLELFTSALAS